MAEASALIDAPLGAVRVTCEDGRVTGVELQPQGSAGGQGELPSAVLEQLSAYFLDGSMGFDLAVGLRGTAFQLRVWHALQTIPPGRTVTYGELARALGTGARAIGSACRANPCPIVVPCHRVVAAHGLGGFGGDTSGRKLAIKRWLLRHEGHTDL